MKDEIVVIGGYGHVGGQICKELSAKWPGKIYAAGRSLARAEAFAVAAGGCVKPLQLSTELDGAAKLPPQTGLVVMCLDQQHTGFAESCLRRGIHYVDVSAGGEFLAMMERLNEQSRRWPATAVLSVGLAPGLTNLLARRAAEGLDEAHGIDIAVLLGLGDSHGKAAIAWTVDGMRASYPVIEGGETRIVRSFSNGKRVHFGGGLGWRTAYLFPFSDQQTLPRTLRVPTVTTRLCFDSRPLTFLLGGLRKIGLLGFLNDKAVREAAVTAFGRLRWGSDICALKVVARGLRGGSPYSVGLGLQAHREAELTARTAAAITEAVYLNGNSLPGGVYHSDQMFSTRLDEENKRLFIQLAPSGESADNNRFEALIEGAVCELIEGRLR